MAVSSMHHRCVPWLDMAEEGQGDAHISVGRPQEWLLPLPTTRYTAGPYTAPYTAKWQMYSLYIGHSLSHATCAYTAYTAIQLYSLYSIHLYTTPLSTMLGLRQK